MFAVLVSVSTAPSSVGIESGPRLRRLSTFTFGAAMIKTMSFLARRAALLPTRFVRSAGGRHIPMTVDPNPPVSFTKTLIVGCVVGFAMSAAWKRCDPAFDDFLGALDGL